MSNKRGNDSTRREFLTRMGVGAVAANLAGPLLSNAAAQLRVPDPPGKQVGFAIVGLGSLAINQILPAFDKADNCKVVALVSGHPDKAQKLAARYGVNPKNIYNYQNYDTIRDNPEVDVIYIVLPNGMHAEYTIRGFQAGKHVLSEKPMANTPADCQAMIDAGKKANRKLMVGYRCRYEPINREAIRMARSKEFGPVQAVIADHGFNIGDPTQWRLNRALAGGGSLMDIGIYSLQAARYITGEEPIEVNAMEFTDRSDVRFKEVEENINFQLRFPSGALANCTSSYGYAGANRYRVIGTTGWFELDTATAYTGNRLFVHADRGREEREMPQRDHFALEMQHMAECVMQNKEPLTPGEEGLRDLKIMAGIYEAAKTGKTVKLTPA